LLAERPLRDVHALGSPTEVQLLRNRYEISQMSEFHCASHRGESHALVLTGRT
jgi:hypothetical protein